LTTCCQRLSGDLDRTLGSSEAELRMDAINQKIIESEQSKGALKAVCARLDRPIEDACRPDELERIVISGIDAMDGLNVDRLMPGMTPNEATDPLTKARLEKVDRTLAAVAPFDGIITRLTKLLDRQYRAFLPTSQYFGHFLDSLTSLKGHMAALDADSILRPIDALSVKSVELFSMLAISLSGASFAPEYSENHHAVTALLDAHQTANDSIARLRILLEEKEQLLLQETAKLENLEHEFAEFTENHSPMGGSSRNKPKWTASPEETAPQRSTALAGTCI
jgi:hypothetical protein